MLQYIYKPADAGLIEWPPGTLRLAGVDVTEDPAAADVFVCPGTIRLFELSSGVLDYSKLRRLPHFVGKESKHVFFDVSDNFTKPLNLPIMFIRCDVRSWMLPSDPNTIQMAWPVEDFSECIELPEGGFKYDVSFHGWNWSDARKASTRSCLVNTALNCDIALYTDFFGYLKPNDPENARRRSEFRRSMRESRLALCPESIPGVFPYRFFEAMSAGRAPVLVSANYVFPFADEIPYNDFIFTIDTRNSHHFAGTIIKAILQANPDNVLIEKGKMARHYWEKYLDSRRWPEMMAHAVRKKCQIAA